jgi:uncharacterized membrane protein YkvA (DUF1232 family)
LQVGKEFPGRIFGSSEEEAKRVAANREDATAMLERAMDKAEKQEGRLRRVWADLSALLRLARAWTCGRYRQAPWRSIVLAFAAILYFLNPMDIVPDALLAFGYLDDATVIAWVVRSIQRDLDKFLQWEKSQPSPQQAQA